MKTSYAVIPEIRRNPIGTPRATRWCGSAPPSLSTWTNRCPLVPRLRPMLEDRDAAARPLPRLLALPRGELDRPLSGGGAHLGGDRPVRPARRAPAPLHVLLGLALHLAQPRLARAGRGARPDPPRRRLRDGGEPPVAARHPRAVPALRARQVGVEDRELPRAVHRLEHVAQPLHPAPARQPRQRRAGARRLRAGAGAGKLDHDVPRGDALARRAAARLQAGRLHARAADRRAHPAHRDRGHGERAAEARLRPAGTARDPGARARRDPPRDLRARAGRGGDGGGPGAVRGRARRARAGRLTMDLRGAAVAVTGATGFLGRYLVDVLLARGARVIGVVRNPGRVPGLAARGVELRQADLGERDGLARGFAGAQAVVSNAALFSLRNRSWEDHQRANIQGTENVFGAVAGAIARAPGRPVSIGRAYNVTGDDATVWEFARAWREAGGRGALVQLPLPVPWRRAYDITRAREDLGWRNRSFVEALRETFALERRAGSA